MVWTFEVSLVRNCCQHGLLLAAHLKWCKLRGPQTFKNINVSHLIAMPRSLALCVAEPIRHFEARRGMSRPSLEKRKRGGGGGGSLWLPETGRTLSLLRGINIPLQKPRIHTSTPLTPCGLNQMVSSLNYGSSSTFSCALPACIRQLLFLPQQICS